MTLLDPLADHQAETFATGFTLTRQGVHEVSYTFHCPNITQHAIWVNYLRKYVSVDMQVETRTSNIENMLEVLGSLPPQAPLTGVSSIEDAHRKDSKLTTERSSYGPAFDEMTFENEVDALSKRMTTGLTYDTVSRKLTSGTPKVDPGKSSKSTKSVASDSIEAKKHSYFDEQLNFESSSFQPFMEDNIRYETQSSNFLLTPTEAEQPDQSPKYALTSNITSENDPTLKRIIPVHNKTIKIQTSNIGTIKLQAIQSPITAEDPKQDSADDPSISALRTSNAESSYRDSLGTGTLEMEGLDGSSPNLENSQFTSSEATDKYYDLQISKVQVNTISNTSSLICPAPAVSLQEINLNTDTTNNDTVITVPFPSEGSASATSKHPAEYSAHLQAEGLYTDKQSQRNVQVASASMKIELQSTVSHPSHKLTESSSVHKKTPGVQEQRSELIPTASTRMQEVPSVINHLTTTPTAGFVDRPCNKVTEKLHGANQVQEALPYQSIPVLTTRDIPTESSDSLMVKYKDSIILV